MGSGNFCRSLVVSGTPGGTRTPDAQLRTLPLYPLSYRGMMRCLRVGIATTLISCKGPLPTTITIYSIPKGQLSVKTVRCPNRPERHSNRLMRGRAMADTTLMAASAAPLMSRALDAPTTPASAPTPT